MDKKHIICILIGVAVGVIAAPKLRTLPLVSKLPSI